MTFKAIAKEIAIIIVMAVITVKAVVSNLLFTAVLSSTIQDFLHFHFYSVLHFLDLKAIAKVAIIISFHYFNVFN